MGDRFVSCLCRSNCSSWAESRYKERGNTSHGRESMMWKGEPSKGEPFKGDLMPFFTNKHIWSSQIRSRSVSIIYVQLKSYSVNKLSFSNWQNLIWGLLPSCENSSCILQPILTMDILEEGTYRFTVAEKWTGYKPTLISDSDHHSSITPLCLSGMVEQLQSCSELFKSKGVCLPSP